MWLEHGFSTRRPVCMGSAFKERKDIPVYQPDPRLRGPDAGAKPLALFYCDYFKRDNKNGGAWMSAFVPPVAAVAELPVVYNVANLRSRRPANLRSSA